MRLFASWLFTVMSLYGLWDGPKKIHHQLHKNGVNSTVNYGMVGP